MVPTGLLPRRFNHRVLVGWIPWQWNHHQTISPKSYWTGKFNSDNAVSKTFRPWMIEGLKSDDQHLRSQLIISANDVYQSSDFKCYSPSYSIHTLFLFSVLIAGKPREERNRTEHHRSKKAGPSTTSSDRTDGVLLWEWCSYYLPAAFPLDGLWEQTAWLWADCYSGCSLQWGKNPFSVVIL